jgi:hypothetical protein
MCLSPTRTPTATNEHCCSSARSEEFVNRNAFFTPCNARSTVATSSKSPTTSSTPPSSAIALALIIERTMALTGTLRDARSFTSSVPLLPVEDHHGTLQSDQVEVNNVLAWVTPGDRDQGSAGLLLLGDQNRTASASEEGMTVRGGDDCAAAGGVETPRGGLRLNSSMGRCNSVS